MSDWSGFFLNNIWVMQQQTHTHTFYWINNNSNKQHLLDEKKNLRAQNYSKNDETFDLEIASHGNILRIKNCWFESQQLSDDSLP